jgi:hypothetical protein
MNNAIHDEPYNRGTSLNAGDEKELVLEYTFYPEYLLFLFPVINRFITPAAAAIIAKHAQTN